MVQVRVIPEATDQAIAEALATRLELALDRANGAVSIAVPGGSTPFPIMAELARRPLDWRRVTVWPTDDRQVPEAHPASNSGRISALLQPAGAQVMRLELGAVPPHLAFSWLGMGEDGHIASLFPPHDRADGKALIEVVPDPLPPEAPYRRISMTIPALLDADEVIFVIRGASKRAVFDAAARGEHALPVARLLCAAKQPVTCFT